VTDPFFRQPAAEFLDYLEIVGFRIRLDDGNLIVEPANEVTQAEWVKLRAHRAGIVANLEERNPRSPSARG
jgi:hypothetical protein